MVEVGKLDRVIQLMRQVNKQTNKQTSEKNSKQTMMANMG